MAEGELPYTRLSSEAGMTGLFSMANGFSNLIQPSTIGSLIEDQNINQLTDFTSVPIPDYLKFGMGFLICGAIGVLLAFIVPISGCSVWCARGCRCCCSCCGGRKRYREEDHSRCKEYGCAGALFAVTAFLLASVVCSFVATEMFRRELDPKTGTLEDVLQGIKTLDNYVDNTVGDLNVTVVDGIGQTKLNVFGIIDNLPNETRDRLGDDTGVREPLLGLSSFTNNLTVLSSALSNMTNSAATLVGLFTELETSLEASRISLSALLPNCSGSMSECQNALDDVPKLTGSANFNNVDDLNVQAAILVIDAAISANLADTVNDGLGAFNNISNAIFDKTSTEMETIKDEVDKVEDEVVKTINDLTKEISNFDLSGAMNGIINAKPRLEEYGHYAYAGLISLDSLMLLIVVLFFIGLIVGLACPAPAPKARCCDTNAKHGARLLLAASGFAFIFSAVIAVVVLFLFIGGGIVQTMACRHLMTYDASMESLEDLLWVEIRQGMPEFSYNISFKKAMEECKQNHSFYKAADAEENGINITDVLDLDKYGISDIIGGLKNISIELGDVDVIDTTINDTIIELENALNMVDFDSYTTEIDKGVTDIPLNAYAKSLSDIASQLADSNPGLSSALMMEFEMLNDLYTTNVSIINAERALLKEYVNTASTLSSKPLTQYVNDLAEAESTLNSKSNEIIKTQVSNYSDEILDEVNNFAGVVDSGIQNDVGTCRSVYDAGVAMAYAPCVYFLDPINSIWFSYGWFLIFCIPALILAIQLADIFQVMMPATVKEERIEMEPTGDNQHYALYYAPRGQTVHYGINDTKIYPEAPGQDNPYKRKPYASNRVYPAPELSQQSLPMSPPPGYDVSNTVAAAANGAPTPVEKPPKRKKPRNDEDYFRS